MDRIFRRPTIDAVDTKRPGWDPGLVWPSKSEWNALIRVAREKKIPLQELSAFNPFVSRWMTERNGLVMPPPSVESACNLPRDQPIQVEIYQRADQWFIAPESAANRMLVWMPTGAGKTQIMWNIVNNFIRLVRKGTKAQAPLDDDEDDDEDENHVDVDEDEDDEEEEKEEEEQERRLGRERRAELELGRSARRRQADRDLRRAQLERIFNTVIPDNDDGDGDSVVSGPIVEDIVGSWPDTMELRADRRIVVVVPTAELVRNFMNGALKDPGLIGTYLRQLPDNTGLDILGPTGETMLHGLLAIVNYLVAGHRTPDFEHNRLPETRSEPSGQERLLWSEGLKAKIRQAGGGVNARDAFLRTYNPFKGAVVLLDEFHNIQNPAKYKYAGAEDAQRSLRLVQQAIYRLDVNVHWTTRIVGFTATAITRTPQDLLEKIRLLRGRAAERQDPLPTDVRPDANGEFPEDVIRRIRGYISFYSVQRDFNKFPRLLNADAFLPTLGLAPEPQVPKERGRKKSEESEPEENEPDTRLQEGLSAETVKALDRAVIPLTYARGAEAKAKADPVGWIRTIEEGGAPKFKLFKQVVLAVRHLPGKHLVLLPTKAQVRALGAYLSALGRTGSAPFVHYNEWIRRGQRRGQSTEGDRLPNPDPAVIRFILLPDRDPSAPDKDVTQTQIDHMLKRVFDSPQNAHGQLVPVAIGLASQYGEGVDYNHLRWEHVFSPPADPAQWLQYIGRMLRFCSHRLLPTEQWTTMPILYLSVPFPTDDGCLLLPPHVPEFLRFAYSSSFSVGETGNAAARRLEGAIRVRMPPIFRSPERPALTNEVTGPSGGEQMSELETLACPNPGRVLWQLGQRPSSVDMIQYKRLVQARDSYLPVLNQIRDNSIDCYVSRSRTLAHCDYPQ